MDANTTNVKKEVAFKVTDGPNVHVLFDACKYAYSKNTHIDFEFKVIFARTSSTIGHGADIDLVYRNMKITSIRYENASEGCLNIEGWCEAKIPTIGCGEAVFKGYMVEGYYNAQTRKGFLKFKA